MTQVVNDETKNDNEGYLLSTIKFREWITSLNIDGLSSLGQVIPISKKQSILYTIAIYEPNYLKEYCQEKFDLTPYAAIELSAMLKKRLNTYSNATQTTTD